MPALHKIFPPGADSFVLELGFVTDTVVWVGAGMTGPTVLTGTGTLLVGLLSQGPLVGAVNDCEFEPEDKTEAETESLADL